MKKIQPILETLNLVTMYLINIFVKKVIPNSTVPIKTIKKNSNSIEDGSGCNEVFD
jgi:antitoxin component of RelBE/YafQ-DinJ toxin-antitoxin module